MPPQQLYTSDDVRPSMSETVLTGTNRKEDSPVKMAHRVVERMLTGCIGVFKGVVAS